MTRKFSEYVSPGHPDKCADYISEYILDRYLEKDPDVRYAVEVMIKGNMVHLAGEVTSTAFFSHGEYTNFVREALKEIGYTYEYYQAWGGKVIDPEMIEVQVDITAQSPEISQGVDNDGWGDQGIFFGYADPDEEYMAPRSHSLAKSLCHMLYIQAKEKNIGGIDIKTEIILDEDGQVEKIIAAVPCRNDDEYRLVFISIEDWCSLIGLYEPYPEIILNGTGNYVMHGPVADCGVTGRKLVVDFYGRHQREDTRARSGSDRFHIVLPKGGTTLSPDPISMFRVTELPSSICALSWSFCPNLSEIMVPEPTPTIDPSAAERFIRGKVTASPESAIGPTPWPINARSTML